MTAKPTYEELAQRVTELEKEREKITSQLSQAQKMEAIGTLAGGIAHDFNNILFPIFGYAEMAMEDVPDDSIAWNYMHEVFKAANRAKELVQQILTFSRRSPQIRKPLLAQMIIKEALKLIRASLPTTIEIRPDIERNCGPILADPTEIHQVMMNLCTNAYHAMREKGGIMEVRLKELAGDADACPGIGEWGQGKYLCLTVSDTGHGIEKADLERIFFPYFTTKLPDEGTGLGLAVVHGIVKSYGGHITVHSEPDRGATFHIYLPRIDSCYVAREKGAPEAPARGSEHILLVEDDPQILQMIRQMLEGLGYRITPRLQSLGAFETFCMQPDEFDLVITDQIMPQMTGKELARKLMGIRPDIPVILCTGNGDGSMENGCADSGIREIVLKPLVMCEIARTVRRVLDGNNEGPT